MIYSCYNQLIPMTNMLEIPYIIYIYNIHIYTYVTGCYLKGSTVVNKYPSLTSISGPQNICMHTFNYSIYL